MAVNHWQGKYFNTKFQKFRRGRRLLFKGVNLLVILENRQWVMKTCPLLPSSGPFRNLSMHKPQGNGNPLQYSCLENPIDRGAWRATVHGVAGVGHELLHCLSSVQVLRHVQLLATPWTTRPPGPSPIPGAYSELMSTESVMPSTVHPLSSPSSAFNLSQHQGLFR